MPESSSSPVPAAAKRACDACHRRKVKCIGDGTRPCKNCTSAGLTCTYNAIPQKKGPKGSRAKVITELRETQRQTQMTIPSHSPPISPGHLQRVGILSTSLITTCVDYYFANMYPTQPILHRRKVGETIGLMETSADAYCLVVSLCAYVMIQPNLVLTPDYFDGLDAAPQSTLQHGQLLLQEVIRIRKSLDYVENPSVWSIITSFYVFGSYFCLDKHNTAWFHLREATTLVQTMGLHDEAHYTKLDHVESSRRRRLYWLLFITERAYALQQHRPLTLQATIESPNLEDEAVDSIELSGFLQLINLFRPFDDTFVGVWNKSKTGVTSEWLAHFQQQLSDALPTYLQCTESQAVDLRCSQQWLRMMVWQLSISHGFLSSAASEKAMSFGFPIEVSRDLVSFASSFSQQAMEVHGIGLIEKLFDIACTLTDVMAFVPYEHNSFSYGPRDYLNQLTSLITSLRGGSERYLPLLMTKINDTLPVAPSAYSMCPPLGNTRLKEVHTETQQLGSAPTSVGSTPFSTPPPNAISTAQAYGFPDMHMGQPAMNADIASVMVSGDDYPDFGASAPLHMFSAASMDDYAESLTPEKYTPG